MLASSCSLEQGQEHQFPVGSSPPQPLRSFPCCRQAVPPPWGLGRCDMGGPEEKCVDSAWCAWNSFPMEFSNPQGAWGEFRRFSAHAHRTERGSEGEAAGCMHRTLPGSVVSRIVTFSWSSCAAVQAVSR